MKKLPDPKESGVAEHFVSLFDALAVVADGILRAGHEVDGRGSVHFRGVFFVPDEADALHHVAVETVFADEAAKRIVNVFLHVLLVAGEPVKVRVTEFDPVIVRSEGDLVERLPLGARALFPDQRFGQNRAARDHQGTLLRGAADDGRVAVVGIADQIGPREEAAHAVAEEDIGHVRVFFLHRVMDGLEIVDHPPPAVFLGKEALVVLALDGLAVSEMVVRRRGEAVLGQEAHEIGVAVGVLGDAVSDLHEAAHLAVGRAGLDADAVDAGAGDEIKVVECRHGLFLRLHMVFSLWPRSRPRSHRRGNSASPWLSNRAPCKSCRDSR